MSDHAPDHSTLSRRSRGFVLRAALFTVAAILAASVPARAQLVDTMKFQTSFPFVIANVTMPAGSYTVTPLPSDNSLLRVSNGQTAVLLFTENDSPRRPPRNDEVTFTKQGDTYVLRGIWDASTGSGVEPVSSARVVEGYRHSQGR
ncbi:MAG TPA: hypothetical protein VFJ02_22635 [Vicinamibacterales bacterium]|nr:hypothetical protein [Vicinamibacterales bacterium]